MFFRGSEKQNVLNLSVDLAQTGELAAGIIAAGQPTLSTEEKVKQYFEQMREPLFRYLTATFGGEHAQAEEITQDAFVQLYRYMSDGHPIQNVRACLTKTPAQVVVTPQTPGQPESGHIRAVFMKDNQQFGLYSPEFAVTVS